MVFASEKRSMPPNITKSSKESANIENSCSENMETYNLFYTPSLTNVTLHIGYLDSPAEYYFESRLTTPWKPQLYLRKGATKASPTIGAAKIQLKSRHTLVARGNYEDRQDEVTWEQLSREKNAFKRSDYTMSVNDGSWGMIDLRWRKDRSKSFATVYDCVDGSGTVVARLWSGGMFNWEKGGEIDVLRSSSEILKEWLLLSALAIWAWEAITYKSVRQGFNKKDEKKF